MIFPCLRGFSLSGSTPTIQRRALSGIHFIGNSVCVNGCLSVLSLRQDGNLSEVYPASCFIVAGPLTLDCFSRREWMGGWVDYRQASSQASNVDFIGFVFCAQRFLQIPGSFWKTLCTEDAMFYFIEHYSETICRHIFSSLVNFCPF